MKKLITIAAILTLSGTAYADNDFHSAGSGFILFQDSRVSTVATTGAQPSVGSSSVNYDNLFWGGAEG